MTWQRALMENTLHCDGEGCDEAMAFNHYTPIAEALETAAGRGWCRKRGRRPFRDFCPKCREGDADKR